MYIYMYIYIYTRFVAFSLAHEATNEPRAALAPQARNFGDQPQRKAEGIAFATTPRG